MAVFVNPATGERFENVPDDQAEAAQKQFGLVTPEQYAAQQEGALAAAGRNAGAAVLRPLAAITDATTPFLESLAPEGSPDLAGTIPTVSKTLEPFLQKAEAAKEAYPVAATVGELAGAAPLLAATLPAAAAIGEAGAAAAGLSEAAGTVAGAVTESGAVGGAQEAQEAQEQGRDLDWWNVAKNGVINLALAAALPVAGAVYSKAFGGSPLEQAVQSTITRTGRAGENLGRPEVNAAAASANQTAIDETAAKLQAAVADSKAPVAKNLQAQRDGLLATAENLRDDSPDVAQALEDAANMTGQRSYQALRELAAGEHGPDVAQALDDLTTDRALWGDKAVDHYHAVNSAQDALASGPTALADAVRGLDDEGVQKLVGELDQHVQDQTTIEANTAFGDAHQSTVGAAHDSFTDTDYETAIKDVSDGKYKNTAQLAQEAPGLRNLASKDFANSLDRINDVVNDDLSTLTKYDDYAEASQNWSQAAIARQNKWIAQQTEALQEAGARIDAASSSGKYPLKGLGTKAQEIIDSGLKRLADAPEGGARMAAVDNLKKRLQSYVMLAGRNSAAIDQQSRQFAMSVIEPVQERIRLGLEDATLWGKRLANLQRDTNAAWSGSLKAIQLIQDQLTERAGQAYNVTGPGAIERVSDSAAIERMLAHPEGGGTRLKNALNDALQGYDDLAAARQRNGFTKLGRLDEFRADIQNLRKQYDFASVLRTAENEAPAGDHVSGGAALAANVALHGAEFYARAHGLPIGQAARSMGAMGKMARFIDKKVKPALGFKPSALVESADNATDRVLATHLMKFRGLDELKNVDYTRNILGEKTRAALKSAGAPVAGVAALAGAAALGGTANAADPDQQHAEYLARAAADDTTATARALTDPAAAAEFARRTANDPSTLAKFQGEHATIQQAFAEKRDAVQRMLRDPDSVIDALGDAFGGLSPALRDSLGAQAMTVATYLREQLPPQRGVSVTRPNGLPPSSLEARTYALKYQTALDPSTAFDDAKRGQLRHEQVDTLRAVSPGLYDDLRSQTLVEMGNGRSTIVQRQRADLLFGYGSALDPAFSPSLSAAAAAQRLKQTTSKAPGSAPEKTRIPANLTPGGIQALNLGNGP